MKANNLRLGNFVQVSTRGRNEYSSLNKLLPGFYFTTAISYSSCTIQNDKGDIHTVSNESTDIIIPAFLNKDWLVKFGFKDDRIMLPGDGELEIRLKGGTFHIWPTDGQTESHNYRYLIRHVHQLQNLYFALTGEELTVK